MSRITLFLVALSTLCWSGCSGGDGTSDTSPSPSSERAPASDAGSSAGTGGASGDATGSAGGHAPAGFVPGSYEDWCGSHNVPESACTRCNASLIPAFQATGDWCAEHGLPESQCLACSPDLVIQRPPRPGGE